MESIPVAHTFGLGQAFCGGKALSWSRNNKVAFSTEFGVYIMDMKSQTKLSKQGLYLSKFIIPPESSKLNIDDDKQRSFLHSHLELEKLFNLFLNRIVSPNYSGSKAFKGYYSSKWSPVGINKNNRYFLVTLTLDYQIILYKIKEMNSTLIKKLSLDLFHYLQENSKLDTTEHSTNNKIKANLLFSQLQDHTYKLATSDILWTNVFSSTKLQYKCIFVFAIQKSGHIVVWKLKIPFKTSNDSCELCHFCYSSLENPTTISWFQKNEESGILAIGNSYGQVSLMTFSINEECLLTTSPAVTVWKDRDFLAVHNILFIVDTKQKKKMQRIALVITKETVIVSCYFDTNDNTSISFNSLRAPCNLHISGLAPVQDYLFASSLDGSLMKINYKFKKEGLMLSVKILTLEIEKPQVSNHGIEISPNGTFLVTAESFNKGLYDVHVCREPLKVHWMIMKKTNQVFDDLLNCTGLIRDHFDDLECMRLLLITEESIPTKLIEICQLVETSLSEQSTQRLKIIRMLLLMLLSESQHVVTFQKQLEIVENLIMERHMINYLEKLHNEPLEGANIISVNRMCKWLQNHSSSVKVQEMTISIQDKLKCLGQPVESCVICQEPEICENYSKVACKNGHCFFLCCRSLLTCNTTTNRVCYLCQKLAVSNPDGEPVQCTFCDALME